MNLSRIRWPMVAVVFALAAAGPAREGEAIFRLFRRWWYGSAYVYPPVYGAYAVQAQYVPQTYYRQQCSYVPVTTYRPVTTFDPCTACPVTAYRPVVVYRPQVTLVPYTSYRIVYSAAGCTVPTATYGSVLYPSAGPACCAPAVGYADSFDRYAPPAAGSTLPYDSGSTLAPQAADDYGTGPVPTYEDGSPPQDSGESSPSGEQRLKPIPDTESDQGANGDDTHGQGKTQQDETSGNPRLVDPDSTTASRPRVRPWSYSRVIWPARQPAPVHPAASGSDRRVGTAVGTQLDDGGWRPSRR